MENQLKPTDRWKKLGFGIKPSLTLANQESVKKMEKSEKLKELTELLRRNKSSSLIPPIPPPRKSKSVVSVSKTLDRNEQIAYKLPSASNKFVSIAQKRDVSAFFHPECLCLKSNKGREINDESLKPGKNSPVLEFVSTRERSSSPSFVICKVDSEICTNFLRPDLRKKFGSYIRKRNLFRSASLSQIEFTSRKCFGTDSNLVKDQLTDKIGKNVINPKQDSALHNISTGSKGKDIAIDILKNDLVCFESVSQSTSNIQEKLDNSNEHMTDRNKMESKKSINVPNQLKTVPKAPATCELLQSNLEKVENISPINLYSASVSSNPTICLVPVPVHECSLHDFNSRYSIYKSIEILQSKPDLHSSPEVRDLENRINEQFIFELVPSYKKDKSESTKSTLCVCHSDLIEVEKRYSRDDIEIGRMKRSSLDCPIQRFCSIANEKQKTDKSKRRKGMYIESSDWEKNSPVSQNRKQEQMFSTDKSSACQLEKYSSILCSSFLESKNYLDQNNYDFECRIPNLKQEDLIKENNSTNQNELFPCANSSNAFKTEHLEKISMKHIDSIHPASTDQDYRYSKRLLRGPYGQILEAEMKNPNRLYFEELNNPDSVSIGRTGDENKNERSFEHYLPTTIQYTSSFQARKFNNCFPISTHSKASSIPSQIENVETTSNSPNSKYANKYYPSNLQNLIFFETNLLEIEAKPIQEMNKNATDVSVEKYANKSENDIHMYQIIRESSGASNVSTKKNRNNLEHNILSSPELLEELLRETSEKLGSEQNQKTFADTRTHVVQEIFRNEQSYVESLQTVILKYFKVLKSPENAGMIDPRTVDEIFFMVSDILSIHEKFLDELRTRLENWVPEQKVGDAFVDIFSKTEVLEVYTSFVNNCSRAKNAIRTTKQTRPSFAKFLETTAREHKGKLTLDNLLIKPVQKFPNYEMLFTRLIKHTEEGHPDQKHLQEVLKLVHDILVHINCKEKEILENGQRETILRELENIIEGVADLYSADRNFITFDLVLMPSGQGPQKERGFFLFNDLLVITSIKKRSGTIKKPNNSSCPGSIVATLDTNKYKFLTKVSLDHLEIIKSKDENLQKKFEDIEQLTDDCNKLQQIAKLATAIKHPHHILEEVIRETHREIQRHLSERQSNGAELKILEITVNSPSGIQKLVLIFSTTEKRSQFEDAFNEAKLKLAATLERHIVPEFITAIPIVKTRAGLQFTCAAPTLSEPKDVWVCNSDGYVGQICVMSLSPEPNVTSCNGVCNARILCLASVPANSEYNRRESLAGEEVSERKEELESNSSENYLVAASETKKDSEDSTNTEIQLDSNSSSDESDSERIFKRNRIQTPVQVNVSVTSHQLYQNQNSNPEERDGNQSTMWLGTEDGYIHVYNCTDTIRIKKNKIKIQHPSAIYSIL